ncbi:hypothetical protein VNO77_04053 [Canavalia gladiata]|uniref:Uncharacterized protein n=1 Tax=Canavalia gladiata TaxID=3824 RepID=A0AAN9N108_CANGL
MLFYMKEASKLVLVGIEPCCVMSKRKLRHENAVCMVDDECGMHELACVEQNVAARKIAQSYNLDHNFDNYALSLSPPPC